jgi:hypothetical protein
MNLTEEPENDRSDSGMTSVLRITRTVREQRLQSS